MLAQESGDKCTAFQILAQRAGIIGDRNPQPATPNWGYTRQHLARVYQGFVRVNDSTTVIFWINV